MPSRAYSGGYRSRDRRRAHRGCSPWGLLHRLALRRPGGGTSGRCWSPAGAQPRGSLVVGRRRSFAGAIEAGLLRRPMRPEDVYELRWAADPRISPDGHDRRLRRLGRRPRGERLLELDLAGSARRLRAERSRSRRARSRTPLRAGRRTAAGSPSCRTADGKTKQLYVIPATGGEARRLTDLAEDVTEAVWSPDGTRLAFTARVRDPAYEEEDDKRRRPRRFTRLQFKLDSEGWTVIAAVTSSPFPPTARRRPRSSRTATTRTSNPQWSPDGRRIVFASARQDDWDIEMLKRPLPRRRRGR